MAEISRWSGIRNTDSPERLKIGEMTVASDVSINNSMKPISRGGQTVIDSTAAHSLFEVLDYAFIAHGSTLKTTDGATFVTVAELTSSAPISYDVWAQLVFYSNGTDKGIINGTTPRQWGIEPPSSQPVATATAGSLLPGKYLYAITYIRSDGQESGTGLSGLIELTSTGGILFTNIQASTDPLVSDIMLYVSSTNGEALLQKTTIPNGQTHYAYTADALSVGIPLITQFLSPPPAGTIVRYFFGRMFMVVGNMVYFSKEYQPELFDLANDYLRFESAITMLEGVNDGLYLGTEKETWFVNSQFTDPTFLFDYGVVANTAVKTLASKFETAFEGESRGEQAGEAVIWTSKGHGICLGRDGGATTNLTEVRYGMGDAEVGAAVLIEEDGYNKYVVVLRGESSPSNIFVGD